MGVNVSRTVEIMVVNKTQNITLRNPRIYFYSGSQITSPCPSVSPGCSTTCKFTNTSIFWGCNGVLSYEAESFTVAISFSIPMDRNLFSNQVGLELSLDRAHRSHLRMSYDRLVGSSGGSSDVPLFPCVILREWRRPARLSAGPVTVTVNMAGERSAVVMVEVEEREDVAGVAGMENPGRARRVQEK